MLITEVGNMTNLVLRAITASYRKNDIWCLFLKSIFAIKSKKRIQIAYIACYNIVIIRIDNFQIHVSNICNLGFSLITYFLPLNNFFTKWKWRIKKKSIFYGFLTQFLNMILWVTTFCSAKVLSQEKSKFADLVLQGAKEVFIFI
jgi:hypothetical protein